MRFYNPTPRQYESTYIDQKLPYDFLLKAGQQKQAKYDENLGKVQGLKKEIEGLPIDQREIASKQKLIDEKINNFISSVPNQDYTEPGFQRKFLQAQQEINTIQRESTKAYKQRLKDIEGLKEEISKTQDPIYKQHLYTQLKEYYNPEGDQTLAANYDEMSGKYNPANQLKHFDYRNMPDITKDVNDLAKSINEDKTSWLSNDAQGIRNAEYQQSLSKGSNEFISHSKAYKGLINKSNDVNMIKSLIIQRNPDLTPSQVDEYTNYELQNNKIQTGVNKRGEPIYNFNPSTLSGNLLKSSLDRTVYNKEDEDRNILTDPLARQKGAKAEQLRSLRGGAGFDEINAVADAPGLALFDRDGNFDATKIKLTGSTKGSSVMEGMSFLSADDFYSSAAIKKKLPGQISDKDATALADIANWARDNGVKSITPQNINKVAKDYYNDVANKTLETSQTYAPNLNAIKNINSTYLDESFRLGNATVFGKGTKLNEEIPESEARDLKFQDFVFRNGEPYWRWTSHAKLGESGITNKQGKSYTISITDETVKQPFKLVAQADESIRQIKRSGYSDKQSLVSKDEQDYVASEPTLRKALGTDQGYKLVDVLSSPEDRAVKYVVAKGRDVKVFGVVNGIITPMSWTDAKVDLGNNILYDRKLIDVPPIEFENILEEQ